MPRSRPTPPRSPRASSSEHLRSMGTPPDNHDTEEAVSDGSIKPAEDLDDKLVAQLACEGGFDARDLLTGLQKEAESLKSFGVYEEVHESCAVGKEAIGVGLSSRPRRARCRRAS